MKVDFELDRTGWAEIAVSPPMVHMLESVMFSHAKPFAETLAAEFTRTGDYEKSFRIENTHETVPRRWPLRRAAARLLNISDHAKFLELGTDNNSARHTLRKTLEYLIATGVAQRRHGR